MAPTRIFIHGLESSSQGVKAQFFTEKFPDMLVPDFSGSLAVRMTRLQDILRGISDVILVGSSFGGLMATLYSLEHEPLIRKIILLAPALNFDPSLSANNQMITIPTWLYVGKMTKLLRLSWLRLWPNPFLVICVITW